MTSNLGSQYLLSHQDDAEEKVMELVRTYFKPEFLNRIDEIVIFNSLSFKVQVQIAAKLLEEFEQRLLEQDFLISFDPEVTKWILKNGFDENYGARPLKRFIQRHIETFIAHKIINDEIVFNHPYELTVSNDELILKDKNKTE